MSEGVWGVCIREKVGVLGGWVHVSVKFIYNYKARGIPCQACHKSSCQKVTKVRFIAWEIV